jgi:hypothetical protein
MLTKECEKCGEIIQICAIIQHEDGANCIDCVEEPETNEE